MTYTLKFGKYTGITNFNAWLSATDTECGIPSDGVTAYTKSEPHDTLDEGIFSYYSETVGSGRDPETNVFTGIDNASYSLSTILGWGYRDPDA